MSDFELLRRGWCATGRVLRRNTDDLDASAARDVHRVDDIRVLRLRSTLHEDHFLRTGIVDLLETRGQAITRNLLAVDGVLATFVHFQDDLVRVRIGWSDLRI